MEWPISISTCHLTVTPKFAMSGENQTIRQHTSMYFTKSKLRASAFHVALYMHVTAVAFSESFLVISGGKRRHFSMNNK